MGLRVAIVRSVTRRPLPPKPAQTSGRVAGANRRWTRTPGSSWIWGLRYVPGERTNNRKYTTGSIDMKVKNGGQVYRYGPGINEESFLTWINAASRGKYFWRYWTRRWSPATKI